MDVKERSRVMHMFWTRGNKSERNIQAHVHTNTDNEKGMRDQAAREKERKKHREKTCVRITLACTMTSPRYNCVLKWSQPQLARS